MFRPPALLAASLALFACDGKGPPLEPPIAGGKADIADRVPVLGALAPGGEVRGELREDLEFHGYLLEAGAGAVVTIEVSQLGSSRSLDSTLFVYGPAMPDGGYGESAIAFDDDSGWGRLSRLRDLELAAGGRYLVVIGSHDGRGRGRYRIAARCESGDCAPGGACHPVIAADIRACADLIESADGIPPGDLEAIEQCSDAEAVADAYDAVCQSATPAPFCDGSYEAFATGYLPRCTFELEGEVLDRTCALGDTFWALRESPTIVELAWNEITSTAGLSALERQQIVLAVQASSHEDVTTAEEALSRVDQNEINQVHYWDTTGRRGLTVYEYGVGDNSYGRIFATGTTDTVALIGDGEIRECAWMVGDEGRPCAEDAHCRGDLRCTGRAAPTGRGVCIDLAADDHPAQGAWCAEDGACPLGSGLVCAGLSRAHEGICLPAWMRRRFVVNAGLEVPPGAGGATSSVVASGLATVGTDVWLTAAIVHPGAGALRVTLSNPAGTEVVALDGAVEGYLEFDVPLLFSGEEGVNGVWTLRVVDPDGGARATLHRWSLVIGSRWE